MDGVLDGVWTWLRTGLADWGMTKTYIACAIAGGSVIGLQFGLGLLGFGDVDVDTDVDADIGDDASLHILSVRAIGGFLTFFGLVGWLGHSSNPPWGTPLTLISATASGAAAMLFVAWMMRMFRRLTSHGNVDPSNAVGRTAQVYLRIPGNDAGRGKITLSLQGRSVEFAATTKGEALPTGVACRIVTMTTPDMFEVASLDSE